jgi:histidinol-phosphate/aromatic aminotransferase/cobyric acid decarboxylase-like protein
MSVSRRSFFRTLGWGGAGVSSLLASGGRWSWDFAATLHAADTGIIRLSNNENNRGPGAKAIDAIRTSLTPRMGRGYPPDSVNELSDLLASIYKVDRTSVIVGTGSGPILEGAVRAFCTAAKPLVTAAPTYGTPENTARRMNVPVKAIKVDAALQIDLNAMATAA